MAFLCLSVLVKQLNLKILVIPAQLEGVFTFYNFITDSLETNDSIKVELERLSDSKIFSSIGSNFNFIPLKDGRYRLTGKLILGINNEDEIIYTTSREFNISCQTSFSGLELELERSSNTSLKLQVVNNEFGLIPGANVCISESKVVLDENLMNCGPADGVLSQTTGPDGSTIFYNLEPKKYFIKVWTEVQQNIYTNFTNDFDSTLVLSENIENTISIDIEELPPSDVDLELTIKDSDGNPLPNMNFCLYQFQNYVDYDQQDCGALSINDLGMSGITNSEGIIRYSGLDTINYFYKAIGEFNEVQFSNEGFDNEINGLQFGENTVEIVLNEVANTVLNFHLRDSIGAPLPNVSLGLYANPLQIDTTDIAIIGGLVNPFQTDQAGNSILNYFEFDQFYIKATAQYGNIVLDNFSLDLDTNFLTPINIVPGTINIIEIELR